MVSKFFKNPICVFLILFSTLTLGITNTFGGNEANETIYPFRIVQMSDTQPPSDQQCKWDMVAEIVETVNSLKPSFVIYPGDITHLGTEDECRRMKELLSGIEAEVHYVPGNHDTICSANDDEQKLTQTQLREKRLPVYRKYFGPERWSFEYGDFLFVGFDSTDNWPYLNSELKQWLMGTFLNSDKPYKFAVMHYTHAGVQKSILEELFVRAGAIGLLHGHNHIIQAYKDTGTGRLVFSSGSAAHIADYGVMYFDVNKDSLACFWKPVHGDARPLGVFDLKEAKSTVSRRKNIFEIAPYIQQLKPNEVTVKWQSKVAPVAAVVFKKQGKDKWDKKDLAEKSVLNEVKVDSLRPGTKYEFYVDVNTVEFGQVKSPTVSFKTPSIKSDSATFAVYGDTRTFPDDHRKVATAIADKFADTIEFCLHVGDLVGDGRDFNSWSREFFNPAEQLTARVPLYPVLGNHEMNSVHYFNYFDLPGNERWYSLDRGSVHVVCLDWFSSLEPDSGQYKWLKNDLANSSAKWKIMVLHSPFFSSGSHGRLDENNIPVEPQMADLRRYILPLLEEYGVNMVFSGHDHLYERSKKGNIYYIISGGGGAPLSNAQINLDQNPYSQILFNKHHYCVVEATPDTFDLAVYDIDGNIIDEVKLR